MANGLDGSPVRVEGLLSRSLLREVGGSFGTVTLSLR